MSAPIMSCGRSRRTSVSHRESSVSPSGVRLQSQSSFETRTAFSSPSGSFPPLRVSFSFLSRENGGLETH